MIKMKHFGVLPLRYPNTGVNVWPAENCDHRTVQQPSMIELKKLSPKFEAANPDIK